MDESFGALDCRHRADTIMMSLLRSAMDNAHESVQSKDGPIECLHERSMFYELAIIQIEGSLQLIQEETDSRIIPETNREKMLTDLIELQDLLRGRLNEMRFSIMGKDKELMERLETELKLRQALESRERELLFLRSKLEFERTKSESIQEFILSHEEGREGDFSELRYSFEESKGNEFCLGTKVVDDLLRPEQNIVIKQMSSDIDILKGTLDLAFGRMQTAEVRPLEKQWGWSIEKETISILIKGFLSDLKHDLKARLEKREQAFLSSEHCFEMIDEVIKLRNELAMIVGVRNNVEGKKIKGEPSIANKSDIGNENNIGNICMEGGLHRIRRASSEPIMELLEALPEEDLEDNSGNNNYVAKMIKNHESIIKKQQEELNWLKVKEALRRKAGGPTAKAEKELDVLERRIQRVITRLDDVITWSRKSGAKKFAHGNVIPKCHIPKSVKKKSDDELAMKDEKRRQKQEKDESELQNLMVEENYVILLTGLAKDFYEELCACDMERSITEYVLMHCLREMSQEWRFSFENGFIEVQIKEDIYNTLLRERLSDLAAARETTSCLAISRNQDVRLVSQNFQRKFRSSTPSSENIENLLKEDVYMVFFREMEKELNMEKHVYELETFFREDVYGFVINEVVKDAHDTFMNRRASIIDQDCREEESLIQNLDSFLEFFEKVEEDFMKGESNPEIKEQTDKSTTFGLVSDKLEKAMRQLSGSKKLLTELKFSLEEELDDENVEEEEINLVDPIADKSEDDMLVDEREDAFDSRLAPLIEFKKVLVEFDDMIDEKLQGNYLRLEQIKDQVDPLLQLVASTRKNELLYMQAFTMKCHNLQLAENEVDLLGDQVEALLSLLEKIYLILDQYSPMLSRFFEVHNILKLIKKELTGVPSYTPDL